MNPDRTHGRLTGAAPDGAAEAVGLFDRIVSGAAGERQRAGFAIYPSDNLSVIVLTNLQAAGPDSLGDGIAALYLK